MTTVQVALPDELFSTVRKSPDEVAVEMRLALAIRWYAQGVVTQGQGAEIAGLDRAGERDVEHARAASARAVVEDSASVGMSDGASDDLRFARVEAPSSDALGHGQVRHDLDGTRGAQLLDRRIARSAGLDLREHRGRHQDGPSQRREQVEAVNP